MNNTKCVPNVTPKATPMSKIVPVKRVLSMPQAANMVLQAWMNRYHDTSWEVGLMNNLVLNARVKPTKHGYMVQFEYLGFFVRTNMNFTYTYHSRSRRPIW